MDQTSSYPRVTRVLRVLSQSWLSHWVAYEERKRMLKLLETMRLDELKDWVKNLPRCTDEQCYCAAQTKADEGAEKGSDFHQAVDAYLHGGTPEVTTSKFAYARWLKWWKTQDAEVVAQEFKLVNHTWRYKGTADILLRYPGKGLTVGDWKTSNHMSPLYYLQLALYTGAGIEMGLFTWEDLDEERAAGIFRFDKREKPYGRTKDIVWITRAQLKKYWDVACSLRRPYDFAMEHDLLKVG